MSSKVDDRIVNMKIDNSQFQKGVADTTSSLQKLKDGLNLKDSGKGLDDLATKAKNFSLQGIADGVQGIASKFSALSIVGITALANIANRAVNAGLTIARSLTIDPIKAGFNEYELKMGSIQTILANTSRFGTKLPEVTKNLDELNTYADKTIYDFGQMTQNIGLFTNAGIKIGDATSMIKGFSNEAAASGTNAQGAASAAYQLSQALSAGTIRLMDWRSLQNVGMGNKNMQNGLIEIANAMGTVSKAGLTGNKIQKDFNGSLEKGWLSAGVMSTYLKIMAGDYSETQMKALGLSKAQITAFKAQAKMGQDAATKVRTFTQLYGTLQEAVGSGWTDTFDILIGNFNDATHLWTNVNDTLGGIVGDMAKARNDLLKAWAKGGGRDSLLNSVANVWKAAVGFLTPIKQALEEVFPPITAKNLIAITKGIENFTKSLIPSADTMDKIKRTAKGFFDLLDIGRMIVVGIIGVFGRLFGAVAPVSGGILDVTANLGDMISKFHDSIQNGTGLTDFFTGVGNVVMWVVDALGKLGAFVGNTLNVDNWAVAWSNVADAFHAVYTFMQPVVQFISGAMQQITTAVKNAFSTMDFNVLTGLLNAGLIGGLILVLKKTMDKFTGGITNIGGGIFGTLKSAFSQLSTVLQGMQEKLKAEVLIKIAQAVALLAASVIGLSLIDTGKAAASIGLMTAMFGQLIGTMALLSKLDFSSVGKIAILSGSMVAVGASMVLASVGIIALTAALKVAATMSWEEIGKGLTAVGGSLLILAVGLTAMDGSLPGAAALVVASLGLIALGAALKIMATLSWDDIGRGMATLGASLAILAVGLTAMDAALPGAAALVVASVGLIALGTALKIMATLSWDDIGRGMATLGASLAILAVGLTLMVVALPGAAALVVASAALIVLGGALKILSTLSWDDIGRSMVALGGSLLILAVGLTAMIVALPGAAALTVAAGALAILVPVLLALGSMSWSTIGTGLGALAATLGILAVAGVALLPALPGLVGLGAAVLLLGAGTLAAGIGVASFAAGLTALSIAGVAGIEALKQAVLVMIGLIPAAMTAFAQGVIDFAVTIAKGGAQFTAAMTTLLDSLINAIHKEGPKIINTLWDLLMAMADKLTQNVPILVRKGGDMIIGVLNGMRAKVPGIATAGTALMITLMNAIAAKVPQLADAGAKAVIKLVNGVADAVDRNAVAMGKAGGRLASAIIRGMVNGIGAGIGEVVRSAQNMAANALNAAKNFLGIHSPSREFFKIGGFSTQGMAKGILSLVYLVSKAGKTVGMTALDATKAVLQKITGETNTNMNMTPTIRPVLDLTGVKKDASQIDGLVTPKSLTVDRSVAYADAAQQASDIASHRRKVITHNDVIAARAAIVFNQYNNSPKALSSAEIYRKTNNQLSRAKKELTTVDA